MSRGKETLTLTQDHKPDREDEVERIEKIGGRVECGEHTGYIARVNGTLAVSRSIGDYNLKSEKNFVSGEPEISEISLCPDDNFIIIASDGLWDVMDSEDAVHIVRDNSNNPSDVGDILTRKAFKMGSGDNITALVIWLNWLVD